MTCPHRIDVAGYLLGALDPPDSRRMREHLATCRDCRTECGELCDLPVLLSALTSTDIDDIVAPTELPEDLCDSIIAKAAARRRGRARRRLLASISAAVVLVVGSVFTSLAITGGPAPIRSAAPGVVTALVTVSATDPGTRVHGSASLTPYDWGTQIRLQLDGVAWGQQCMLVVSSVDGQQDTAGTWVANYRGDLIITGASAIPIHEIRGMDVVTKSGVRLVALPPPH